MRSPCTDAHDGVVADFLRCRDLATELHSWLVAECQVVVPLLRSNGRVLNPPVVTVEGPSYARMGKGSIQIGQLHAAIYSALVRLRYATVVVCPPTVLKRWVADKGNASKELVLEGILRRWFREGEAPRFGSQDLYEAYALARLGEAVMLGTPKWLVGAVAVYDMTKGSYLRVDLAT